MENNLIRNIQGVPPKKEETVELIADKIVNFLNGLHEIDPQLFNDWYEQAGSKKEALQKKVLINTEFIQGVVRKEWDKKFPELGSGFSFWSGKDDLEDVVLTFGVGMTTKNKNINNVINIKLPFDKTLRLKKDDEKVSQIVELIKRCWNPVTMEIE